MLPAYQQLPPAILAAREDEALTHGQVMYGLVKPTKDMSQVESTAAMVNVIPKKRIYRMENPEEIDLFMTELMKRPLVLQPSAYIGRGFAAIRCTFYTKEERWVMLINQAHPKVYSRIQMGIETAKKRMSRGEPFILEISFNAYLKRVYLDRLTKAALDHRFTFIDFEDAEIVIRYPGDRYHRGMQWEIKSGNKIRFDFEDLLPSDITRRTVSAAQGEWNNPALRVIMHDEMQTFLPGWNFEDIDPLDGVMSSDDEEGSDEGAVGGIELPAHEVMPSAPLMPDGKVVGRARRKAMQGGEKMSVPVELHIPEQNGPQTLYLPSSHRNTSPSPDHNYERLNRKMDVHENPYANKMVQNSNVPRSPRTTDRAMDLPYETMNMNTTGQYGQQLSPHGPSSPMTPSVPGVHRTARSPRPNISPQTPTTPRTPTSPRSPASPHTPSSLRTPASPHLQNQQNGSEMRSYSPMSQQLATDKHSVERVNTRTAQQTYLTDEDDGGFRGHSPKSPQHHTGNMYDSNFNKQGIDRYSGQNTNGQNYNPRDRYADQQPDQRGPSPGRPDDLYRGNPSWKGAQQSSDRPGPVPAPRGFHRYQGSGRSDTSASDSGFGETENGVESSTHKTDRYGSSIGGNDPHNSSKTPYYNRGFQQDSPEHDRVVVDDILAKHKAMAAKMLHQQGQSVSNSYKTQDFNNADSNYNRELQKWRRNINDLEQSCNNPEVNFSPTRLRVDSNEEPMEESFI